MSLSTHKAEVVPVSLEVHPNSDFLSIVKIFGYTVCARTEDWKDRTIGIFCPPDSLVPISHPYFSFLTKTTDRRYAADSTKDLAGEYIRITAKKLRGYQSYGLLVPCQFDGLKVGDDAAEVLGITHFNPPETDPFSFSGGEVAKAPEGLIYVKYDVDSFQRYAQKVFIKDEPVWITEKIHGASHKMLFHNGEFHCGSRNEWKKEFCNPGGPMNLHWGVMRKYPGVMKWMENHPGYIIYGELYGKQSLKYGLNGSTAFAAFDIMKDGNWLNAEEAREIASEIPWVPVLEKAFPYDFDKLVAMSDGPSLILGANHFREGIVIKTLIERRDLEIGRVQLKIVSPTYLEKEK